MPVSASTSASLRSSRLEVRFSDSSLRLEAAEAPSLSASAVECEAGVLREPRSSLERRAGRAGASGVSVGQVVSGSAGGGVTSGAAEAVVERRVRRGGRASRAGAGSVSSPEPKSSEASGAGVLGAEDSAVRRRRGLVWGSSADSVRAAARRRGRWLVPSESERLVGICGLNPIMLARRTCGRE